MRIYPMVPFYIIAPIMILAVCLFALCLIKKNFRKAKNFRRIAMIALMALILLRPVILGGLAEKNTNNLNLFFAIDMSTSMFAIDENEAARYILATKDIKEIVQHFPGSRYSIIVSDGAAHTLLPLTSNMDLTLSAAESMHPLAGKQVNSDLAGLINFIAERTGEQKKYRRNRSNVIIIMSDGENNAGGAINVKASYRSSISGGAVLGYGSKKGSTIKYLTNTGESISSSSSCVIYNGSDPTVETRTEDSKKCVVTKIDETNLKKVANDYGISYYYRGNSVPDELYSDIESSIGYVDSNDNAYSFIDTYWAFGIGIIVLLLWEFRSIISKILSERNMNQHAKS